MHIDSANLLPVSPAIHWDNPATPNALAQALKWDEECVGVNLSWAASR
jgi:hypothetical protein